MGLLFLYPAGRREPRPVKRRRKNKGRKKKMEANSVSPPFLLFFFFFLQETGALLIVATLLAMMDPVWLLVSTIPPGIFENTTLAIGSAVRSSSSSLIFLDDL
jgi:hypothetical protein